jgi:integrase
MDLAYLTGQRPADVRKMRRSDIVNDAVKVMQNKTGHPLRIRLTIDGKRTGLGECIDRLWIRSAPCKSGHLICTPKGDPLTEKMLRDRYDKARAAAARKAEEDSDEGLAERIRSFQFRDIRPKAGSEIETLAGASQLLGHTNQAITRRVYRRKGELVDPTK